MANAQDLEAATRVAIERGMYEGKPAKAKGTAKNWFVRIVYKSTGHISFAGPWSKQHMAGGYGMSLDSDQCSWEVVTREALEGQSEGLV